MEPFHKPWLPFQVYGGECNAPLLPFLLSQFLSAFPQLLLVVPADESLSWESKTGDKVLAGSARQAANGVCIPYGKVKSSLKVILLRVGSH